MSTKSGTTKLETKIEEPKEVAAPTPLKAAPAAKLGDDGFMRLKMGEIVSAKIIKAYKKRSADTTGNTTQDLFTVLYFAEWVHGYNDIKKEVTVGKGEGQFWHNLKELQDAVAVERESRKAKSAS